MEMIGLKQKGVSTRKKYEHLLQKFFKKAFEVLYV